MDWGLGNPNKTAALIAMLMVAVWGLACFRKWGFWAALTLFTGLGICLIHTYSRGGLIGCFAGLIAVISCAPRPWPWKKIVAVAVSVWIMVGCSIYLQANARFSQGIVKEDRSITNRLELWKVAPQMMAGAPEGWGLGKSGQAFMQWYQPLDRSEAYRTLVNSHLTWLVEFGWPLRFLYILAWLSVFCICRPLQNERWQAIPLAIWITFAVSAVFSSVAESRWVWILPALSLLVVLGYRVRRKTWPGIKMWLIPLGTAVLITAGLLILGKQGGAIQKSGNIIVVGKGKPKLWLWVDTKTVGSEYGRSLRKFLSSEKNEREAVAFVESAEAPADYSGKTVILTGSVADADKSKLKSVIALAGKVIILNPTFFPQEIDYDKLKSVSVFFGEFSQSPALGAWRDLGIVQTVEGNGDFLPNWPELVFNLDSENGQN